PWPPCGVWVSTSRLSTAPPWSASGSWTAHGVWTPPFPRVWVLGCGRGGPCWHPGDGRVIQFSIEQLTGGISGVIKRFDPREGHQHVTPSPEPKRYDGAETMLPQWRPLIEVLGESPDFGPPRGRRHPLAAMLALACSAMLGGYRSYTAIAEWGRNYGAHLTRALGFTRQPPCAATLHTVFRRVDREVLEAKVGAWAEGLL